MIKVKNHIGCIELSSNYLKKLIAKTAASCFGVVGMNSYGPVQSIRSLVGCEDAFDNGVIIRQSNNTLIVDLHISVSYGINITAIVDSIINKVRFTVEEEAGIEVSKVNVYIDSMHS
ncbi:MAG: Asp23/Gls24 family envelope stress response protein [Oscillospiraceae bacterium]|nr:Asp23/Gls24 family envelope stress response protein [Oscillospiraceae bacterium]MBQ7980067.1 Asp23/Gls24 family envelope stress response protein [Oscillospiraceae bacterium]